MTLFNKEVHESPDQYIDIKIYADARRAYFADLRATAMAEAPPAANELAARYEAANMLTTVTY
jgi:hypothetical protein